MKTDAKPSRRCRTLKAALTLGLLVVCGQIRGDEVRVERVGQWPGWPRGYAWGVAVSGNYAYVASGEGGLQVIDVSNPANPQRVGVYDTSGDALGVAVSGNYAYVADGRGLQVIDVSDPANPRRVGGYGTPGWAYGVAVSGNYAYVADGDAGLVVIDVSNPASPQRVGGYDTSGHAEGVAVSGNYAYVADGYMWTGSNYISGGLQVIDVSDPANPRRVGGYDTSGDAEDVAVSGNYAYVAAEGAGLLVIDVSDPANPRRLGGYDTSGLAYGVAVSGHYAYVADWDAGLQVIDVSNPANPQRVGGYNTSGDAYGVAVSGNYAYVADYDAGLQVIDVSNPAKPQRVGGYDTSGYAYGVAVSGNYAYVADGDAGLQVIDVSNPANPQRVGGYYFRSWYGYWYALGVAVSGNYAYMAAERAGLQVIDVSNPANPQRVGGYDTSGYAYGVAVSGNYAYVADWDKGLQVIDVSNPAYPRWVGRYDTSGYAFGVAVSGNYAYVADYDVGLQVIDVSNPANPRRVGGYDTSGYAWGVAVSGNYAYVADGDRGLQVIDVSDPANPRRVGGYDTSGYAYGVAVSGNYAYVADKRAGLQVIDVSDPANPRRVGGYDTSGYAQGVAVSGNYVYVADGDWGLQILRLSVPGALPPTLAGVRARQRPGTTLVEVDYELGSAPGQPATVSVAFSRNGGASFDVVPASGALGGEVGPGVQPGTRRLTWDAGRTLPAGTYGVNFMAQVTAQTLGGTARGTSSRFALEVPAAAGGGLQLSGRLLEAGTRQPLAGARVTLGGRETTTSAAGLFSLEGVSLSGGNTLTVSKSGYATYTATAPVPPGATAVTVPDVVLPPAAGNKPVVTGVRSRYEGLFLGFVELLNDFTATVDWRGLTPSKVEFYANGVLVASPSTTGPEATARLNMGTVFRPRLARRANTLRVVAEAAGGARSAPYEIGLAVIPLPDFLVGLPADVIGAQEATYSFTVTYPSDKYPVKALENIRFLGDFGWDLQFTGGCEYALESGEWVLYAGVQPAKSVNRVGRRPASSLTHPKFYVGNAQIDVGVKVQAEGTAKQTEGIVLKEAGVVVFADVNLEILTFYLTDYVPWARWVRILDRLKKLGVDVNSVQRVRVYGLLGYESQLMLQFQPTPVHFDGADMNLELGLEAAYEPNLRVAKMRVYVGGRARGEFQIAYPPPSFHVKRITGSVYGGVSIESWLFDMNEEFVILQGTLWQGASGATLMPARMMGSEEQLGMVILPVGHREFGPMRREYLQAGPERFVAAESKVTRGRTGKATTLADFRRMGERPAKPATGKRPGDAPGTAGLAAGQFNGPTLDQADLVLVENVYPGSDPAMASRGPELMLLYVGDNGSPNTLQCTDIRWTRWDGTNWSVPATIHTNTQAEFAPQVAYDGKGDAIAVWERVADPNFNQADLTAMAAQMEIVWSKWNRASGQWSVPQPLTANSHLDHAPLVCGPMTGGKVLAVWTANTANLLMGTNGAGSQVWWAEWNPADQSWSSPQMLLADLPNRLSQSLSGVSNLAVYAWMRDWDGVLTNATDQQVFYCTWTNGAWSAAAPLTSGSAGNRNVRAAVSGAGDVFLFWQQGSDLVMSRNFSLPARVVRAAAETAGFADYALTAGPDGHLVLLWQEMSPDGSDAHYRVYDPAADAWSRDERLFRDAPLERSFAPVWDDLGNLTVAYNKVELVRTNKTLTLEGGGEITITNVPQSGRVDLAVTKRRLVQDLALLAGDFTVEGENYLPGDPLTLSVTLRNMGDLALTNVAVAFYDGDPGAGGTLITNVPLSGWFEGASTNQATVTWVVPEPAAPHLLVAVARADGDADPANNRQSVRIGGTDLAVALVSQQVETDGAVRVIAQVQNLGAPAAAESVLAIYRAGATNALLATTSVPALEPGRLARVALDLPAGTQPEGEALYELRADPAGAVADVDPANNATRFAVNLWLDADGDGMPDGWERTAGLDPANPADAAQDADGDGLSNLEEYRAGTDPRDAGSYLWIRSLVVDATTRRVELRWGSVANRLYTVLRSAAVPGGFVPVAEHLMATPPENVWHDEPGTEASQHFYRLKVE